MPNEQFNQNFLKSIATLEGPKVSEGRIYFISKSEKDTMEQLQEFELSPEFPLFQRQYNDLLNNLKIWCSNHHVLIKFRIDSSGDVDLIPSFDLLKSRLWLSGANDFYSIGKISLFNEGKESLERLYALLMNDTIPFDSKKNVVLNLQKSIAVCADGTLTNIISAKNDLIASMGLDYQISNIKRVLIQEYALDYIKEVGAIWKGNEIHYVNGYYNHVAQNYGVPLQTDRVIPSLKLSSYNLNKFSQYLNERLTPSRVLSMLLDYANESLNQAHKSLEESHFSESDTSIYSQKIIDSANREVEELNKKYEPLISYDLYAFLQLSEDNSEIKLAPCEDISYYNGVTKKFRELYLSDQTDPRVTFEIDEKTRLVVDCGLYWIEDQSIDTSSRLTVEQLLSINPIDSIQQEFYYRILTDFLEREAFTSFLPEFTSTEYTNFLENLYKKIPNNRSFVRDSTIALLCNSSTEQVLSRSKIIPIDSTYLNALLRKLPTELAGMILLSIQPKFEDIIGSRFDLIEIFKGLSAEQQNQVFGAIRGEISRVIKWTNDFKNFIVVLHPNLIKIFLHSTKKNLSTIFSEVGHFEELLKATPEEERLTVFEWMKERLPTIVRSGAHFKEIALAFPEFYFDVCDILKERFFKIVGESYEFQVFIKGFPHEPINMLFDLIKDKFPQYIQSAWDYEKIAYYLPNEGRLTLFEAMKGTLPRIIKKLDHLTYILKSLPQDKSIELLESLGDDNLQKLIPDCYSVGLTLSPISQRELAEVYEFMRIKLLPRVWKVSNYQMICAILDYLPREKAKVMLNLLEKELCEIIQNTSELQKLLKEFKGSEKFDVIYSKLKPSLIGLVENRDNFQTLFNVLPPAQSEEFCQSLNDKLPGFIKTVSDLEKITDSETGRRVICKTIRSLHQLIIDPERDFQKMNHLFESSEGKKQFRERYFNSLLVDMSHHINTECPLFDRIHSTLSDLTQNYLANEITVKQLKKISDPLLTQFKPSQEQEELAILLNKWARGMKFLEEKSFLYFLNPFFKGVRSEKNGGEAQAEKYRAKKS